MFNEKDTISAFSNGATQEISQISLKMLTGQYNKLEIDFHYCGKYFSEKRWEQLLSIFAAFLREIEIIVTRNSVNLPFLL